MAKIYNKDFNILITANLNDVRQVVMCRVASKYDEHKSIGWNYYVKLSILDSTLFPIDKSQYHKILDLMKEGLIIEVIISLPDKELNYPEDYGL